MKLHTGLVLLGLAVVGCQRTGQPLGPSAVAAIVHADARPSSGVVSLDARRWSDGMSTPTARFHNDAQGRLYADIPQALPAWGYAFTPSPSRVLSGSLTVTLRVQTLSGAPLITPYEPCGTPGATIRPFLFSYRNDWSGAFSRWWSVEAVTLASGDYTLSIPLTPDRWISVSGTHGSDVPAAFGEALRHVSSVGLSLGTPCAVAHGVIAPGGVSRVLVSSYAVS